MVVRERERERERERVFIYRTVHTAQKHSGQVLKLIKDGLE